ncbi:MAG: tRNA (N6-isopentenyl adenosine(37)-C2)-methylthiotransferase MiaB [Erysipelotrichaceae bacterium]|nr:tRNA (N6-isopentenyl adenosine(37)-C2)-methylthiotransferase MiaB [Erysipelotrichaceae bacterium]
MKKFAKVVSSPNMKMAAVRELNVAPNYQYNSVIIDEDIKDFGLNKKYFIRTYGCQGNLRDSEVIAGILKEMKYSPCQNVEEADIIILNTCCVRENAEKKVFGEIGSLKSLKQKNPNLLIGVCGCMVQQEHIVTTLLTNYQQVDIIFGTHNIYQLPSLIKDAILSNQRICNVLSNQGDIQEDLPSCRANTYKAWVNIMYGCNKFCTYCIVPYTRGKERSRKSVDILNEIRQLKEMGYKEVTLLGQNVNAYGKDIADLSFAELMEQVALTGIDRIRFTTSHPYDFSDELIDVIAKYPNIMKHIQLPVQSGDDGILKAMGRRYNRKQYLDLVKKIKDKIKDVSLTTDIIVGFPNESDEAFAQTLSLCEEVKYDSAFTFIYSPRVGTPAAKMKDNISMDVKKQRFNKLTATIAKYELEKYKTFEGKIIKVLVDGPSKKNEEILSGYSEDNKLVNFKGDLSSVGKIVNVKIIKAKTYTLEGEQVD